MRYAFLFVCFFLLTPGLLYFALAAREGGALDFAIHRPRTALILFVLWCATFGNLGYHWAKPWADTAEANTAATELAIELRAKNLEWPLADDATLRFVAACELLGRPPGKLESTCRHRWLPYVEARYTADQYMALLQQQPASDTNLLPPDVAAIVRERSRADGDALIVL